jgi:TetR/AcrR family transcriptional repressor of mexJK operon
MNTRPKAQNAARKKKPRPLKSRRPRRPSLSNEELLDKALDLFSQHGYERTSVETITATAGMAKRTVYLRFGDKKALFIAALQRAIERWRVPIERLREAERDGLEESLLAIGQILVDNLLSPAGQQLLRLTNAESGRMPEIGEYTVQEGTGRTLAYLADLFRRHFQPDKIEMSEADDAAEAFLHLIVGGPANAAAWGVVRDKAVIDRRIRFSVRLFLHGLMAQFADAAPADATALKDECLRLKRLVSQTIAQLDKAREHLAHAGTSGRLAGTLT